MKNRSIWTTGWLLAFFCIALFALGANAQMGVTEEDPLDAGWHLFRLSEYRAAITSLDKALAQAEPGSEYELKALYALGILWQLRRPHEDADRARSYYERLIAQAPDHDLAAWSMLAMARILHLVPVGEDPDYEKVRAAYRRVMDHFPNHMAGHEAHIYRYSTLAAMLQEREALEVLDAMDVFLREHPDSAFVSAAWSLKAVAYHTLGRPEEKLHAEIKSFETAEIDPQNPFVDNAGRYWVLATIAEFDVGDFDTARHYYRLLIDEYPTDIRIYGSEQALERMDQTEATLRRELGLAP